MTPTETKLPIVPRNVINAITQYGDSRADNGLASGPALDKAIAAIREALATTAEGNAPDGAKYSDIVSTGGMDPRNKADDQAALAQRKPAGSIGDDPEFAKLLNEFGLSFALGPKERLHASTDKIIAFIDAHSGKVGAAVHFVQHATNKPCNEWTEVKEDHLKTFMDAKFVTRTLYTTPQPAAQVLAGGLTKAMVREMWETACDAEDNGKGLAEDILTDAIIATLKGDAQ